MMAKRAGEVLQLRLRVLRGGDIVMGPGRADLLTQIRATGSIAAAGRQMGMSYKRAWALVEAMNAIFAAPLVEAVKGGAGGGGAHLTEAGMNVLAAYRGLEAMAQTCSENLLAELDVALQVPPASKDA
jgi:molybdate transport system regulatory protein